MATKASRAKFDLHKQQLYSFYGEKALERFSNPFQQCFFQYSEFFHSVTTSETLDQLASRYSLTPLLINEAAQIAQIHKLDEQHTKVLTLVYQLAMDTLTLCDYVRSTTNESKGMPPLSMDIPVSADEPHTDSLEMEIEEID